jgi:APA family basic amino acid/polyamine antiporter
MSFLCSLEKERYGAFSNGRREKGTLLRELGVKERLAIGLGTMTGAGIFALSTVAAERVGRAAALSYLLTGMICLPVAMIISELATGMPRAGGSYTFITQASGPLAGSIVGPANWPELTFANGSYLVATGQYLALFLPIPPWAGAAATGLLFTWLNYRGAKISGRVQYVVVLLLIAILALFVAAEIPQTAPISADSFASHGWGAAISVIGLIIVSFTGFEKVSTISEEIKNPDRNLPRAIIGSAAIATITYALLLFVTTWDTRIHAGADGRPSSDTGDTSAHFAAPPTTWLREFSPPASRGGIPANPMKQGGRQEWQKNNWSAHWAWSRS